MYNGGLKMETQLINTIRVCNNCGYSPLKMNDKPDTIINCKRCKIGKLEIIAR